MHVFTYFTICSFTDSIEACEIKEVTIKIPVIFAKKPVKQLFAEKSHKIFWVEGFRDGSVELHETRFFFVRPNLGSSAGVGGAGGSGVSCGGSGVGGT